MGLETDDHDPVDSDTEYPTSAKTLEMMRFEIAAQAQTVCARVDKFVSKNDMLCDEVSYYLVAPEDLSGSRCPIAKGIESKVDSIDEKLESLAMLYYC